MLVRPDAASGHLEKAADVGEDRGQRTNEWRKK